MLDKSRLGDMGISCFVLTPAVVVENEADAGKSPEMRWAPRARRALLLRKRLAFIRSLSQDDARFVRFVHKLLRLIRTIEKVSSSTAPLGPPPFPFRFDEIFDSFQLNPKDGQMNPPLHDDSHCSSQ